MVYIITEDSGSGARLLELISEMSNEEVVIIPNKGNDKLYKCLIRFAEGNSREPTVWEDSNNISHRLLSPSKIIIAFDNFAADVTANYRGRPFHDILMPLRDCILEKARMISQKYHSLVFMSEYNSIEWCILTFKRFQAWVHFAGKSIPRKVAAWPQVQTNLINAFRLFHYNLQAPGFNKAHMSSVLNRLVGPFHDSEISKCDELIQPFYHWQNCIEGRGNTNDNNPYNTCEQAVSGLISYLTNGTGFMFTKSAKTLGSCFMTECKYCQCKRHIKNPFEKYTVEPPKMPECQINYIEDAVLSSLGLTREVFQCPELAALDKTSEQKLATILIDSAFNDGFTLLGTDEHYSLASLLSIDAESHYIKPLARHSDNQIAATSQSTPPASDFKYDKPNNSFGNHK